MGYTKRKDGKWILRLTVNKKRATKYIGNDEAYRKHLKDINRKETELAMLKGNIQKPDMPTDLYDVILADPPWQYDFTESSSRAIENQYPSMPLQQIRNLRLPSAENAVLFLWATAPKLREALEVMTAWGFDYRTSAVWDKGGIGLDILCQQCYNIIGGEGYALHGYTDEKENSPQSLLPQEVSGDALNLSEDLRDLPKDMECDQPKGTVLQSEMPQHSFFNAEKGEETLVDEREEVSEFQGRDNPQRLQVSFPAETPNVWNKRIYRRTPTGNGSSNGKALTPDRTGAPQEPQQDRQSSREPRNSKPKGTLVQPLGNKTNRMPKLQFCSRCGAPGQFIVSVNRNRWGMGYWFRGQHELLLVGVKGVFSPPIAEARYSSVIREARTNHSKKPDCIYTMIEAMFPDGNYLELFARSKRDRWQVWGNEIW